MVWTHADTSSAAHLSPAEAAEGYLSPHPLTEHSPLPKTLPAWHMVSDNALPDPEKDAD